MRRHAVKSRDGLYRYKLTRAWGRGPRVCFVMLNPSTADEHRDDRTVIRCVDFAKNWGYGSLVVVNLFAYIATDPDELLDATDPIGPRNDDYILRAHVTSSLTIAAWGMHPSIGDRDQDVSRLLDYELECIDVTKMGAPRHPTRLAGSLVPRPWPLLNRPT
jgi:hypothetical protein